MKRAMMVTTMLALAATAVRAQAPVRDGQPLPPDAQRPMMREGGPQGPGGPDDPRRAQLRAQVEERFGRMVQAELQLNDQDMQRVRQALRANQDRRIELGRREMDTRRAIMSQLRPGEAANNDSVARMTQTLSHLRVERAQSDERLVQDLDFLPPVKRARLLMMLQRFEERVQDIRRRAPGGPGGPGGPGAPGGPGMRRPR